MKTILPNLMNMKTKLLTALCLFCIVVQLSRYFLQTADIDATSTSYQPGSAGFSHINSLKNILS